MFVRDVFDGCDCVIEGDGVEGFVEGLCVFVFEDDVGVFVVGYFYGGFVLVGVCVVVDDMVCVEGFCFF